MLAILATSWNDRLLRLSFLSVMLMGVAVASLTPFLSVIGIEILGFSPAAFALITTAGALISVAASVLVGIFSDQTGRYREVLLFCNGAGIAGAVAMFLAPAQVVFILAHVVLFPLGAATFTQYFAMARLAAGRNPALDQDVSLSMIRAAFSGAFGLTPPVLAIGIAAGMPLLSVYGVVAVINLVVFALVFRNWPQDETAFSQRSGIGFFRALAELSHPQVLIRLLLVATVLAVNTLYNILLGLLILNTLGGTEADVGWFAGGVALVEVPVMLGAAMVLRHVTRSGMILIGAVIYAGFLAGLAAMPDMQSAWVMIIPGGISAGIILSVSVGYVQELVAARPGAGSSLVSVAHFTGTMIASAILAAAVQVTDFQGTAWIGALLGLLAGCLLFLLDGAVLRKPAPVVG